MSPVPCAARPMDAASRRPTLWRFAAIATTVVAACLAGPASSQTGTAPAAAYPVRPVTVVVPWGPGGSGDITGRTFARYLEQQWKQPAVVENKPGANGIIGSQFVKNAAADGYTMMITSNMTHAANSTLYRSLPYDPQQDFAHVATFGVFGLAALVPAGSPIRSLEDLERTAKARPDEIVVGWFNTSTQIAAELLRTRAGLPVKPVGYKAIANTISDVLGGHIQLVFLDYPAAAAHIASGKLVPIAVTAAQRASDWPQVPALAERYPGFEVISSLGLAVPAATPRPVIERLNQLVTQAQQDPTVRGQLEKLGYTLRPGDADASRRFLADESGKWAQYIRDAKIEPQ